MTRFEAYKGGLFKADLAEGVWIYFHSRMRLVQLKGGCQMSELDVINQTIHLYINR